MDLVEVLARHARRQFNNSHDHGEGGPLDGHKGLVHVDGHCICGSEEPFAFFLSKDAADDFDEKFLRISSAKVESDSFQNEPLEADDDFALGFKYL